MRNWLEYIPFIAIATLVKALPRAVALALGRGFGRLAGRLQKRRMQTADHNLRLALPDLSAQQRRVLLQENMAHLGMSFIEMLRLESYCNRQYLDRHIQSRGFEQIEHALSLGRGCITLSAHIGFWEIGNIFLTCRGFPLEYVAKPMRNPLVDAYFAKIRGTAGSRMINSQKGPRGILRALRNNHVVGILLDQHLKGSGTAAVPFFGHPAHTTTVITELAMKHQVPIVPVFAYREPDNSYSLVAHPMILLSGEHSRDTVLANTARLNRCLEEGIKPAVAQWFWVHRRWRDCCLDNHD